MTSPWIRLDAHYRDDRRVRRSSTWGAVCWPVVLCEMKKTRGVLDDPDPEDLAEQYPGPDWRTAIDGFKAAGLLVKGWREWKTRGGKVVGRGGWVTPRWDEYQEDGRAFSECGLGEYPGESSQENADERERTLANDEERERTVVSRARAVPSRPVSSSEPSSLSKKNNKSPAFAVDAMPLILAHALKEAVASHAPDSATARADSRKVQGWAGDIDKMLRLDGRDAAEVERVIAWTHGSKEGSFWRANILSGKKLREKFDALSIQMKERGGVPAAIGGKWHDSPDDYETPPKQDYVEFRGGNVRRSPDGTWHPSWKKLLKPEFPWREVMIKIAEMTFRSRDFDKYEPTPYREALKACRFPADPRPSDLQHAIDDALDEVRDDA